MLDLLALLPKAIVFRAVLPGLIRCMNCGAPNKHRDVETWALQLEQGALVLYCLECHDKGVKRGS